MKIRMIFNISFCIVFVYFISAFVLAEDKNEYKKIQSEDKNEIAFYLYPEDIPENMWLHAWLPKRRRDFYSDSGVWNTWERTGKFPKGTDMSQFHLADGNGGKLPYEPGDGTYGMEVSGIPISWKDFYETTNFKTKRLRYAQIRTIKLSHLFSDWDLEGSSLELRGNLTNAIVTNCYLYSRMPNMDNYDGQKLKNNIDARNDEAIAAETFTVFMSTWNYKNNRLIGILLNNVDLRKGNFNRKDVSQMKFFNCKFFDETNKNEYLFEDAIITREFTNKTNFGHFVELPNGISKEQLYQTQCYKKKKLKNIIVWHLPKLDLTEQNLEGTTFMESVADYKFDGAYWERTSLISVTQEQLYTTKSYKDGKINNTQFNNANFSCANLSNLNLTGCKFLKCDLNHANFTNSVISNCIFSETKNLTIEQIKLTWNYKNNRMNGIKLPNELQKIFDTEKIN
jgi:uncharacterized protein YjbI with pentapeptide repeats